MTRITTFLVGLALLSTAGCTMPGVGGGEPTATAGPPTVSSFISQDGASTCDKVGWVVADWIRNGADAAHHYACGDSGVTYGGTCSINAEVQTLGAVAFTCAVAMTGERNQENVLIEPRDFSVLTQEGESYAATDRYLKQYQEPFLGVPLAPQGFKFVYMSFAIPSSASLPIALVVQLEPGAVDGVLIIEMLTSSP